jgi:hypothetical protein
LFLLIRLIDKKAKPLDMANGLSADLDCLSNQETNTFLLLPLLHSRMQRSVCVDYPSPSPRNIRQG